MGSDIASSESASAGQASVDFALASTVSADQTAMGAAADRSFVGHPKALGYIVFAEAWERFSFYGMQALLMLYMVGHLFRPEAAQHVAGFSVYREAVEWVFGPLSVQALASQTFGFYVGLIYLMPVIGGLIGDRLTGRTAAVIAGAVSMTIGHFMMAIEAAFFIALLFIILGCGLLKGNLAAQVGALYSRTDSRREQGYSLYCMAINVGVFVAPLVCGTLGELYGWHLGFGAAGIGMIIGAITYLSGLRYLPPERSKAVKSRPKMAREDWKPTQAILVVLLISSLFWIAQSQVWNSYAIWARDRVDRDILDFLVPATWFQSLDGLAVLLLTPIAIAYWRRQAKRGVEPADLAKVSIGFLVFAAAFLLLTLGEGLGGQGKVSIVWPFIFHFVCAWGYIYSGPVTLALISRAAPAPINAMMLGSYYLSIFVGGFGSGWLGQHYEKMLPMTFWTIHAGIVATGGVILWICRQRLASAMRISI